MQSYYGVNSAQSARTGIAAENVESGVEAINFIGAITYRDDKNWSWDVSGGVDLLQGDASDSKVIEDDVLPSFMSTVNYTF